jgi:hypothetical protein
MLSRVALSLLVLLVLGSCGFLGGRAQAESAVAIDIDGVLRLGDEWCVEGREAIAKLQSEGVPFVLMSNGGGGLTEAQYAAQISANLASTSFRCKAEHERKPQHAAWAGLEFKPLKAKQMVLSYTPWKETLAPLKNKPGMYVHVCESVRERLSMCCTYWYTSSTQCWWLGTRCTWTWQPATA